jgi:4-amino-4-deoxy-L-arabinose transferase-like glycosyltransferase
VELPQIMTETITTFLVSAIGLLIVQGYQEQKRWQFITAGLLFGYLVLVKIIFSNVLLALLAGAFFLWLFNRKKPAFRQLLIIPVIAFLVNVPYLLYTWNLTGKKLYWGNSGGMSLYWMSTPYPGEYGEWHNSTISLYDRNETIDSIIMFNEKKLQDNHRADYIEIYSLPPQEQDDAFKKKAIENIKAHPVKFARNMIANAGRLIFDYPYSYTYQTETSLLRISINGILLTLILLTALISALNWRRIPFSLRVIVLTMLLYLGGSLLVSVYQRMFYVILPWMLLWVSYVLTHTVRINLKLPVQKK